MLISIVTPSYNQGAYLAETIESVLGQEGDFSIDYIIADGGSSDHSVEIIRRYEKLLEKGEWPVRCRGIRYRWLSEKDKGQSDALMKGFGRAEGEILAWLNSDDTYLPGALAKAVEAFGDGGAGVVYGKSRFIDVQGKAIGCYPTEPFDYRRLAMVNFICQPSTFFTREAFDAVGGVNRKLHYAMDFDLWIRLAGRSEFRYLPVFLSSYRLHESSKTVSPQDSLANHLEGLETVQRHYRWAPLNRVYGYCRSRCCGFFPGLTSKSPALAVLLAAPYTVMLYLVRNKGVCFDDLSIFTRGNMRNLSKEWIDVHRTEPRQGEV